MQFNGCLKGIIFTFGLLGTAVAWAHTPVSEPAGLSAGLLHPLSGWDHLLALLAIVLWASRQGGPVVWGLPVVFAGGMLAGVIIGQTGLAMSQDAAGIAVFLMLLLGLVLVFMSGLPAMISLPMIGLFTAIYGLAHGSVMTQQAATLLHGVGLCLAAATLIALALALGRKLPDRVAITLLRASGLALGTTGALMVV